MVKQKFAPEDESLPCVYNGQEWLVFADQAEFLAWLIENVPPNPEPFNPYPDA